MKEYKDEMLSKVDFNNIMEIIEASMDDYLYVMDLQEDTYRISPTALERFAIPCSSFGNARNKCMTFIYEDDRGKVEQQLHYIDGGKIRKHDMNYRWLDKSGNPVWVNGRGGVIDDKEGKPRYLIGCVNEIGNRQRADNNSGLLGEVDMRSYLESCTTQKPKGFLIHIGIDNLAWINGTWGIDYGDYVLRSVADCINKCLSDSQKLYHLVSDEYMIVDLKSHTRDDVLRLREKILAQIDAFIVSVQYKVVFSLSFGITGTTMLSGTYDDCRKLCDFSLQQAKKAGKNNYYFYEQEDYDKFLRKGKILSALRNAVSNGFEGFEVYYQPIVDCSTEQVIAAEALMRFTMHSEDGDESISPVEFIPWLEETGLIIPAGKYIMDAAAQMCHEMQKQVKKFRVNINLSYVQVIKDNIWKDILSVIKQHDITADSICVEMTESGYMDMTPRFCALRKKLKANKISFAIDDFGTGYSNLHCICDMNPDYVKIDKDFTARAMCNDRDYELLKKIIDMVHSIGIKICVEGVEEIEWSRKLRELNADYLQGYLYGKPCNKHRFFEEICLNSGNLQKEHLAIPCVS